MVNYITLNKQRYDIAQNQTKKYSSRARKIIRRAERERESVHAIKDAHAC